MRIAVLDLVSREWIAKRALEISPHTFVFLFFLHNFWIGPIILTSRRANWAIRILKDIVLKQPRVTGSFDAFDRSSFIRQVLWSWHLLMSSRSSHTKVHLQKKSREKSGGKETKLCWIGNQIPDSTPSLCGFFGENFCMQTPGGTCRQHTVSVVGLRDPVLLIFHITCTAVMVLWYLYSP